MRAVVKRNLLGAGGISALLIAAPLSIASAADILVKAPPPPTPAYSWTGFYVGMNAGGTWSDSDPVSTTTSNVSSITGLNGHIGAAVAAQGTGSVPISQNGAIGGGQVGYNWQKSNWLLGIETDIQGVGSGSHNAILNTSTVSGAATAISSTGTITSSKSLDYLGTVRGRMGFLPTPSLLVYATGGLAYGGVQTNTTITESLGYIDTPTPFGTSGGFSGTRVGWTAGGGLEWMMARNWSAKVEYLYYDLGSVTNTLPAIQQFGDLGTLLETVSTSQSSTRFAGSAVRVGLNYQFH
jgi:outer membrane immunogenic protein